MYNFLVKKADVIKDNIDLYGNILISRLQSNEDPEEVILDILTWIIEDSMEDCIINKDYTPQEALNYMIGTHIDNWLKEFISTNPILAPNREEYNSIIASINLSDIFKKVRDQLFNYYK